MRDRNRLLAWGSLGVVYIVWGSTYLAIRVGVKYLPPAIFSGVRFLVAGALLYAYARRTSQDSDKPTLRQWLACALVGALLLGAGNGGVSFAEQHLDSGLSAVLVASIPLWMIAISAVVDRRRPATVHLIGTACGLGGVAVLAVGGAPHGHSLSVVILLLAALGWSIGSVLAKRVGMPSRIALAAGMQMLSGGALLMLVGVASGELGDLHLGRTPGTAWLSFAYLVVAGSILAYSAYGYALSALPLTTVATYAYVNPVVALVLGITFVGERLSLRELIGTLIVVGSVGLTVVTPEEKRRNYSARSGSGPDRGDSN